MALIRFGSTISEIRGSINGATFSRNRAGAIIRNRITPVNPNTMQQAQVRYLFSYVASQFSTLSRSQKEEWNEYAKSLSFWKNRLGESYNPSARQVFQYCNTNLILSSTEITSVTPGQVTYFWDFTKLRKSPVMDLTEKPAPPRFEDGDFTFTANITGGLLTSLLSNEASIATGATDESTFIVEATPAYRPSIQNRKNKYRLIQAVTAGSSIDLTSAYNTVLPQSGLQNGQSIYVRLSTVNKAGLRSDPLEIEVIL